MALAATAVALTTGTANAETRDPCQDLRNQARLNSDIANGFSALGNTLLNLGYYDLATDTFDQMSYFIYAAELYVKDARDLGCGG